MLSLLAGAAKAEEIPRWTLRGQAGGSIDQSDSIGFGFGPGVVTTLTTDAGSGFAVGLEWRPRRLWGIELSAAQLTFDAERRQFLDGVETRESGDLVARPIGAALLIHPLRGERADLYVGPVASLVSFDVDVPQAVDRDSDLGYGAILGLDLLAGKAGWAVGLQARYTRIMSERSSEFWQDFHSTSLYGVLSYRFN